jgi:hypothetical protein
VAALEFAESRGELSAAGWGGAHDGVKLLR